MARYLADQIALRPNIRALYRTEVVAAHGGESLEAIDVRDSATGETKRLETGGLFLFIGADAETGWLPPEIALDPKGYVLTGSDVRAAGRWELDRDPFLLETSEPTVRPSTSPSRSTVTTATGAGKRRITRRSSSPLATLLTSAQAGLALVGLHHRPIIRRRLQRPC